MHKHPHIEEKMEGITKLTSNLNVLSFQPMKLTNS